jgi:hypothetical protein
VPINLLRRRLSKFLVTSGHSIHHHARHDAHQSPPLPGETPSPTETKLDDRLRDQIVRLNNKRDRALQTERVNAIATDLAAGERSFDDLVRDTRATLWDARLKFNKTWNPARKAIANAIRERETFKNDHCLDRDAHNPNLVLAFGILCIAFVGETSLNAFLFAQVSRWGVLGGALWAITLTIPNLVLGFIAGFWGVRGRQHIRPHIRWLASILLIVASLASVLWNVAVASFRAFAELRAEVHRPLGLSDWREALTQNLADPATVFASPQTLILFGAGLFAFIAMVYDGTHHFSDIYPGYSRADRAVRRAIAHALRLEWAFFEKLKRLTKLGTKRIDERLRDIERKSNVALLIIERARSIVARFALRAADDLWVHRSVLREYYTINRAHRNHHAIPSRFDEPIAESHMLADYDWSAVRQKIRGLVTSAATAAEKAKSTLHDDCRQIVDEIDAEAPYPNIVRPRANLPLTHITSEAA